MNFFFCLHTRFIYNTFKMIRVTVNKYILTSSCAIIILHHVIVMNNNFPQFLVINAEHNLLTPFVRKNIACYVALSSIYLCADFYNELDISMARPNVRLV